jgi:hypothetical protein
VPAFQTARHLLKKCLYASRCFVHARAIGGAVRLDSIVTVSPRPAWGEIAQFLVIMRGLARLLLSF